MPRLWAGSALSPWLLTVVNLACKAALRSESNRRFCETEAAKMRSMTGQSSELAQWEQFSPHLDEMVERLGKADRSALMLRFYEQKSYAEVAEALGISEEAARKRVSRATDKLRTMLARKGITMPATALAGVLLSQVTTPAPAALVAAISAAPLAASAGTAAALAKGVIAMMGATKLKLSAAIVLALVLGAGVGTIAIRSMIAGLQQPRASSVAPTEAAVRSTSPSEFMAFGVQIPAVGRPATTTLSDDQKSMAADLGTRVSGLYDHVVKAIEQDNLAEAQAWIGPLVQNAQALSDLVAGTPNFANPVKNALEILNQLQQALRTDSTAAAKTVLSRLDTIDPGRRKDLFRFGTSQPSSRPATAP
jgi:predicted DNA-binding protein (UPF0251 family)